MRRLWWKNHIFQYIVIVIIPAIFLSMFFWNMQEEALIKKYKNETENMLNIHQKQIDNLIRETKTKMETMAILLNKIKSKEEINDVLTKVYKGEPRFSGFYIVDQNGYFQLGTRYYDPNVSIKHRPYFQEAVTKKATSISEAYIGPFSHHFIVTLCTPILDRNQNITNVLVATVRVDYIQNIMNVLSPELYIETKNLNGETIFRSGLKPENDLGIIIEKDLHELPWKLEARLPDIKFTDLQDRIFVSSIMIFFVLNVIFLLIQYYLLRRKAKLELIQAEQQKLELVGTLATSTAHEIRNPLTGIHGFVQLLKEKYTSDEDQHYFDVMEKEIERINEIVSEFLMLGKPTVYKHKHYNLIEILQEVTPFISSECQIKNLKFQLDLDKEKPIWIYCTKDHIKQVILNITKNAIESMDSEGALTISATQNKKRAILTIRDTGKGIPPQIINKIFDPFFTLKDSGTGLGLAICQRIIDLYDGSIHINSEINKGTCVTITLPINFPNDNENLQDD
ncbi:ATP-binding protein [Aeribacillus alveayuensis]|uniref:histidine kinase n=1 Tax=Aeribacillus alveayuensis TaxID=279215 RepID=A0ABT9VMQ5_9BACI|nr:two-component system, sporulation sensor kinase D [Bacillus alveayuensis]